VAGLKNIAVSIFFASAPRANVAAAASASKTISINDSSYTTCMKKH